MTRNTIRALALVATISAAARAQDDGAVAGRSVAVSLGVGATSAGIACTPDCGTGRKSGPSFLLRAAGHISPQFALGLEATVYHGPVENPSGPGTWTLSWFMLAAQWYPSAEADFFIKAGLGISSAKADLPFPAFGDPSASNSVRLHTSDYGGMIGFGRDFFITERFALTPYASYLFAPQSRATISQVDSGAKFNSDIIVLGLALSIP